MTSGDTDVDKPTDMNAEPIDQHCQYCASTSRCCYADAGGLLFSCHYGICKVDDAVLVFVRGTLDYVTVCGFPLIPGSGRYVG